MAEQETTVATGQKVSSDSRVDRIEPVLAGRLDELLDIALSGLGPMYIPNGPGFVQTIRGVQNGSGFELRVEGDNLRYAAIVALGLASSPVSTQHEVLQGLTAAELATATLRRSNDSTDTGAVALSAWAAAEVAGRTDAAVWDRLTAVVRSPAPIATVDCSWALTAGLAARHLGDTEELIAAARDRLLAGRGERGIFPHMLPASSLGRWRAHVGCFADQVYPIQALARLAAASYDRAALEAAEATAAQICHQQGEAGQWWWHYDVRDGSVVEGFPVYSVHQHAMAPMALLELAEAGGTSYDANIALGLQWLDSHPEVLADLVSEHRAVIWRKVGRREPPKAARAISAAASALRPGLRVPGLNQVFPPGSVDYECRPYELGWLLYAWRADGVVRRLAAGPGERRG